MKKTISRVIAMLLCLAMVFSFAACKKEKTGKVDVDDLKAVDLKGREIVITSWGTSVNILADSPDATMQTYYARMQEVEKLYNCKFVFKKIAAGEILPGFQAGEMGGATIGDIVQMREAWVQTCYKDNNLLDLSKYFDADMPQFNRYSVNTFKEESGSFYSFAVRADNQSNIIYFNKDMFEEKGVDIDALYKDVKDKKWTVDKFLEIAEKVATIKDGTYETYGAYRIGAGDALQAWHATFGSNFTVKNEEGKFVSGLKSAETKALLEFVKRVEDCDFIREFRSGDNWETESKLFTAGTIGMAFGQENSHLSKLKSSLTFEFGVLPFPLAKEGDDYYATIMTYNHLVMPKSLDKDPTTAKAIADMYTYIYQPTAENMDAQYLDTYEMNTYDEESVENLLTVAFAENYYIPIHHKLGMVNLYNSTLKPSLGNYLNGQITYDAFIAATDSAWTEKINEYFGQ